MLIKMERSQVIDLFRGWPNPSLLPTPALSSASTKVLTTPSILTPALLYGPDEGYSPLRTHIAQWLTSFYHPADPVTAARICITGGASQNLACILQVFSDPAYTRNVWLVAPTYHLVCRIFEDSGFGERLRAVGQDGSGLDLEGLRKGLEDAEERAKSRDTSPYKPPRPYSKLYKHIIYATPTFSNPSTLTMSLSDREALVRLARAFDALIITDDVYDFLQWPSNPATPLNPHATAPLPRLVDVDRYLDGSPKDGFGNVISNGSFSKLVGPGVRTGWAEGTEKIAYGLSQTGSQRSGGSPSQFSSTIIDQLLPSGLLEQHINTALRPAYFSRYHNMLAAIKEYLLPLKVTLPFTPLTSRHGAPGADTVSGGYFIWLALPQPLNASTLANHALTNHGVKIAEGDIFAVKGDTDMDRNDFSSFVRVCFAWEEEGRLVEGVRRLAGAVREMLEVEEGRLEGEGDG
ncbi:pyridoxal phosphate-dependent transferase [Aspergillus crustosus]